MGRSKKPTAAELKKIRLVKMIQEVTSSGSSKDTWNPAEISEGLKNINFIRRLVDTWNPAQLNEAIMLLGFKTIDTWNPAIIDEMKSALIRVFALHSVTGNPITLNLTGELPYLIKEATATFSPKQSGTGDPSPTNIRPISGWDSLNLYQAGVNLANTTIYKQGYVLGSDGSENVNVNYCITDKCIITAGKDYILRFKENSGTLSDNSIRVGWYKSNGDFISRSTPTNNTQYLTAPTNTAYCKLSYTNNPENENYKWDIMLNEGQTALDYVPYQGQTYPATFSDTVYGGNYDFVSGDGSETWGYIASYNGETLPGVWISDRDVYAEGTTPTTGAEVAYELATPTPIELMGQEIEPLPGVNVFSTDADTLNIKYQIDLS